MDNAILSFSLPARGAQITGTFSNIFAALSVNNSVSPGPTPIPYNLPLPIISPISFYIFFLKFI